VQLDTRVLATATFRTIHLPPAFQRSIVSDDCEAIRRFEQGIEVDEPERRCTKPSLSLLNRCNGDGQLRVITHSVTFAGMITAVTSDLFRLLIPCPRNWGANLLSAPLSSHGVPRKLPLTEQEGGLGLHELADRLEPPDYHAQDVRHCRCW
jgi:hypothetical protein